METRDKDYIVPAKALHPGEVLRMELQERGIKQKDFAKSIDVQPTHLNAFIKGKRNLSEKLAEKLESALGIQYSTWMDLQRGFNIDTAAIRKKREEEREAMAYEEECNKLFNLNELYKLLRLSGLNCLRRVARLKELYSFDLRSADSLKMETGGLYKHSERVQVDDRNMLTWLLMNWHAIRNTPAVEGYRSGNAIDAAKEIARQANTRTLTVDGLKACLERYGITYLHVDKIEKVPVDAFSTIVGGAPYITATYRYNDMDKLAFDILHELCHIDKHLGTEERAFISMDGGAYATDPREKEANDFARDMLIPAAQWRFIMNRGCKNLTPYAIVRTIADEAERLGISPSIAVARYKHETGWYKTRAYKSPAIS